MELVLSAFAILVDNNSSSLLRMRFAFLGQEEVNLYCIFHAFTAILMHVLKVSPYNCSASLPSLPGWCHSVPQERVVLPPCHTVGRAGWADVSIPA